MTEQSKINTKIEKAFEMPEPVKWPVQAEARHLVPLADDLGSAGHLGTAIYEISIRAMERAENTAKQVAEAENAVNVAQLALQKSGNGAAGLVQKDGKIHAIPTAYADLASSAEPVLGREQERFDADVRKVASYQEALMKQMDAKLVCADTARDNQLRSDLRNHLKSLGGKASYTAIKAATEGDMATIHTVLTSPAALMGLKPKDVETVRDEARKKLSPGIYKAHAKVDDVLGRMTLASRTLGKKRDSINGYKLADQQAANDALSKLQGLARA